METKELIQEVALELFSKKGYQSSSLREIAAKVGIKESSLYFHYKNKQAILDSLMNRFISTSEQMMGFLSSAMQNVVSINDEQFYMVTEQYLQGYFMDDFISKFIMVMNHERSHNEQLREQYICWCIKKPIEFQMIVIGKLQEIGYLKKIDLRHATLAYYSPIFLYYNQYMSHDYTDKEKDVFKKAVMAATQNFLAIYKEEN